MWKLGLGYGYIYVYNLYWSHNLLKGFILFLKFYIFKNFSSSGKMMVYFFSKFSNNIKRIFSKISTSQNLLICVKFCIHIRYMWYSVKWNQRNRFKALNDLNSSFKFMSLNNTNLDERLKMLDETMHYFIILTLMKPLIISLIFGEYLKSKIFIPPYD
jgi:hypothetical protein